MPIAERVVMAIELSAFFLHSILALSPNVSHSICLKSFTTLNYLSFPTKFIDNGSVRAEDGRGLCSEYCNAAAFMKHQS